MDLQTDINLKTIIETFEKGDKTIQLQSGHSIRIEETVHQEDGSTLVYGREYVEGLMGPREIGKTIMEYDPNGVFKRYKELPKEKTNFYLQLVEQLKTGFQNLFK